MGLPRVGGDHTRQTRKIAVWDASVAATPTASTSGATGIWKLTPFRQAAKYLSQQRDRLRLELNPGYWALLAGGVGSSESSGEQAHRR